MIRTVSGSVVGTRLELGVSVCCRGVGGEGGMIRALGESVVVVVMGRRIKAVGSSVVGKRYDQSCMWWW